jgi:hypothetical protein
MYKMYSENEIFVLLDMFVILWKVAVNFIKSVRLSIRMKQLGSHWTDFHEIWYLSIFQKCIEKIQVLLKSDKNNGYFTQRPIYKYDNILLISS